ncbi:MAG TPA: VCBS repeat-containing protein [Holophagaceae bacterium]|nr:VCBS repeat-containing protein [Holophagaceae bacterium]
MRIRLLLPVIALLALGCTSSDTHSDYRLRYTNAVVVADLDGDNRPDVITGNGTYVEAGAEAGYASISLQVTPGTLGTPTRYVVGGDPAALAVGDLNGDNRPDLVVANAASGTVSVYFQSPTTPGTFTLAATLNTGALTPLDVAIGDLNQDNRPDIAVASSGSNTVQIFYQTATAGTFLPAASLSVSGDPRAIVVADLNGDLRPDLAVSTTADSVSVFFQNVAPGTFATALVLPVGARPVALKAVDLTGSGRLDLITANYRALTPQEGVTVLLQTAPGVFAAGVNVDIGDYYAAGLAVGDLDGDNHPDLVVACAGLPGDPGSVAVLKQNAASLGTFLAPDNYIGYTGPLGVAIGDLNNDTLPDLVVADGKPYRRLQLSGQPGTFGAASFIGY